MIMFCHVMINIIFSGFGIITGKLFWQPESFQYKAQIYLQTIYIFFL